MNELTNIQRGVRDYLLHGSEGCVHHVATVAAEAHARLGIYANAYRLRLHEVLATDFTLLAAWLGEPRFVQLTDDYIASYPSDHFNIRWFGRHMTTFLSSMTPWSDAPLLAELAEFEWVQGLSFDAADAPSLGESAIASLPTGAWESLQISFHPSAHRRDFRWNVHELWRSLQRKEPLASPVEYVVPVPWLFWRRECTVSFVSLDRDVAKALNLALEGADFPVLCEALRAWHADEVVPRRAAELLKSWINEGLISGVCLGGMPPTQAQRRAAPFRTPYSGAEITPLVRNTRG